MTRRCWRPAPRRSRSPWWTAGRWRWRSGFAALSGAEAAAAGATPLQVAERIRRQAGRVGLPTSPWTRWSTCAVAGGSARLRPCSGRRWRSSRLLTVADGVIRPYERVRTRAKAVSRLADLAVTGGAELGRGTARRVRGAPPRRCREAATALGQRLIAAAGRCWTRRDPPLVVSEMSAVLGVHVGPGTLGVVVSSAESLSSSASRGACGESVINRRSVRPLPVPGVRSLASWCGRTRTGSTRSWLGWSSSGWSDSWPSGLRVEPIAAAGTGTPTCA